MARDDHVRLRQRNSVFGAQPQEPALELGPRDRWLGIPREQSPQRLDPAAARVALDRSLERPQVEQPPRLDLRDEAGELVRLEDLGQVEDRAGDGCHGDPVDHGAVVRMEPANAVQLDSRLAVAAPRRGHIDGRAQVRPKAPDQGGGTVTGDRPRTAREHGRHDPAAPRNPSPPDAIYAAIELMETAAAQAVLDRPPPKAQRQELPEGDDAVLPTREGRGLLMTWALFAPY